MYVSSGTQMRLLEEQSKKTENYFSELNEGQDGRDWSLARQKVNKKERTIHICNSLYRSQMNYAEWRKGYHF